MDSPVHSQANASASPPPNPPAVGEGHLTALGSVLLSGGLREKKLTSIQRCFLCQLACRGWPCLSCLRNYNYPPRLHYKTFLPCPSGLNPTSHLKQSWTTVAHTRSFLCLEFQTAFCVNSYTIEHLLSICGQALVQAY